MRACTACWRSAGISGPSSYTTYLFEKGLDKILKKVGEECTEVIIAAKAQDHRETVYEIADLAYHVMVLMVQAGISLEEVREELAGRTSLTTRSNRKGCSELSMADYKKSSVHCHSTMCDGKIPCRIWQVLHVRRA